MVLQRRKRSVQQQLLGERTLTGLALTAKDLLLSLDFSVQFCLPRKLGVGSVVTFICVCFHVLV
jgi:hypothetical protein